MNSKRKVRRSINALAAASSDAQRDYKQDLYESYKSERKELNATALTISGRYDSNMLYIGAGALAVSLTFLEKLEPNPRGLGLFVLVASWGCLVSAIVLHLLALARGQRAIGRQIEILDEDYTRYLYSADPELETAKGTTSSYNEHIPSTARFTRAGLILVISGLTLLCLFSVLSVAGRKRARHDKAQPTVAASPTVPSLAVTPPAAPEATARSDKGVVCPSDELPAAAPASKEEVSKDAQPR